MRLGPGVERTVDIHADLDAPTAPHLDPAVAQKFAALEARVARLENPPPVAPPPAAPPDA